MTRRPGGPTVDLAYADPRLAALHDAPSPPGADTGFHVRLAGPWPLTVLDLGCGTGRLACALAAVGHAVVGVDPAPAMLAIARGQPGGGSPGSKATRAPSSWAGGSTSS